MWRKKADDSTILSWYHYQLLQRNIKLIWSTPGCNRSNWGSNPGILPNIVHIVKPGMESRPSLPWEQKKVRKKKKSVVINQWKSCESRLLSRGTPRQGPQVRLLCEQPGVPHQSYVIIFNNLFNMPDLYPGLKLKLWSGSFQFLAQKFFLKS